MSTATTTARRFVYFFGEGHADGGGDLKHLIGGKGASLACRWSLLHFRSISE